MGESRDDTARPRREEMHVMAKLDVWSYTTEQERRESGPRPHVCPWVAIDKGRSSRGIRWSAYEFRGEGRSSC